MPTFTEAGYPEVVATEWQGLFVPAKTPAPIVDALYAAVREALQTSEVKAGLNRLAFEIKATTPEEFAALMKSDTERWRAIVQASGLRQRIEAEQTRVARVQLKRPTGVFSP